MHCSALLLLCFVVFVFPFISGGVPKQEMASTYSIKALNTSWVPTAPFNVKCSAIKHIKFRQRKCEPKLTTERRSPNYLPAICDYGFIQSLKSAYEDKTDADQRFVILKDYARSLLEDEGDTMVRLELIDTLGRLGVGYLFEVEIKQALEVLAKDSRREGGLHCTALYFRLLRQNGHMISQDVFSHFMDENGKFREDLREDTEGILSLYEASFLALEGESVLDEAAAFTTRHLNEYVTESSSNSRLCQLVEHALTLPLHWMPPRLEARWFIDAYATYEKKEPLLLELAKLDYNICQASAQGNVRSVSRWWKSLGVTESLNLSRDRLPESFILALGTVFQPKYGSAREGLAQLVQLVVSVDDLYEHHGIIEELELFTVAVEQWDVDVVEQLPDYTRPCYLALLSTCNQLATLTPEGCNILPLLKKLWLDLCKSNLKEAKWFSEGYTPTLDEYLDYAQITIGVPLGISIVYFLMHQQMSPHALDLIASYPDLIQQSAIIFRLCDDIAESIDQREGDPPNSLQHYMWERGATHEAALEHAKHLLSKSWKKMNKYLVHRSPFQKDYIDAVMGMARIVHWCYLSGDGFTTHRQSTLETFKLLVVEPIPEGN